MCLGESISHVERQGMCCLESQDQSAKVQSLFSPSLPDAGKLISVGYLPGKLKSAQPYSAPNCQNLDQCESVQVDSTQPLQNWPPAALPGPLWLPYPGVALCAVTATLFLDAWRTEILPLAVDLDILCYFCPSMLLLSMRLVHHCATLAFSCYSFPCAGLVPLCSYRPSVLAW